MKIVLINQERWTDGCFSIKAILNYITLLSSSQWQLMQFPLFEILIVNWIGFSYFHRCKKEHLADQSYIFHWLKKAVNPPSPLSVRIHLKPASYWGSRIREKWYLLYNIKQSLCLIWHIERCSCFFMCYKRLILSFRMYISLFYSIFTDVLNVFLLLSCAIAK